MTTLNGCNNAAFSRNTDYDVEQYNGAILLYVSMLVAAYSLAAPTGILGIPLQFFLKDQLHLSPGAIARFSFVTGLPLYFGFLFGLIRDRWRPFGRGDRGYLLIFTPLSCLIYIALSWSNNGYAPLIFGMLGAAVLFRFLASACQGLTAELARDRSVSGHLSTLWNSMTLIVDSCSRSAHWGMAYQAISR